MNRSDIDWVYLRDGMLVRLVLCGASLLALGASVWGRAQYTTESDIQQQQMAALDQQRTDLASRLQARARYSSRFDELQANGVVGEEQRLDWAQVLRDSATALRLPYLRYAAAPQQPFEAAYLVAGVTAPVMSSTMEVQAGLVHEVDLLRLIAKLREEAPGFFGVMGCALERVGHDIAPEPNKANITGSCRLRWYSIPLAGTAVLADGSGPES